MLGKTIAHYKILEELGRGGMGVVYKAQDTKLKRTVALKFLRAQALEENEDRTRFIREAQSAAALDHPNICTVYEVGETDDHTYISMAYIEGESLRERISSGPVSLEEALDYALQAAKGLRAAHEKGIVHRDIKSANLMLTPDGRIKVMDFGLAKTAGATRVTRTGTTLGTVAYMSPEQTLGQVADHRSDIWSLGVVLYEMLAGRLPFAGEYDPALLYAIVNERHEPLTQIDSKIPLEVEQLVDRTLEKDPVKRYQSAEELITDLEGLRESLDLLPRRSQLQLRLLRQRRRIVSTIVASAVVITAVAIGIRYFTGSGRAIDSIAVLPFENLTGDSEEDPLVDGMAMELTSTLGRVSGFKKVMPYRSMKLYKGTNKPIADIADRVDVKALVAGTISYEGDRIRAIVEMIEGSSERLLWTQSFEFDRGELAAMMDDILGEILSHIGMGLTEVDETSIASSRSENSEAYLAYLRGRALSLSWSKEGLIKGIEMLERAIELDSTFALAYVVLSLAYCDYGMMYTSGREEYPKAKKEAMKALELDDSLPEVHMALAAVQSTFEWDWSGAERSLERAIELGPDNADVNRDYATFLAFMTRFDEALALARKAIELDPIALVNQQTLGWILYHAGRFDESIAQFEKTLVLLEEFPNDAKEMQIRNQIIWNYIEKGMFEEAIHRVDELEEKEEGLTLNWLRAWAHVEVGRGDEVQELIDELLVGDIVIPLVAATLGDNDLAFQMLEKFYEEHNTFMIFTKMAIELEGLRSDPRYDDLIRRLNFPE
jgi:serine/threonine protein kinase/Tfp pilus assembly protein PilF